MKKFLGAAVILFLMLHNFAFFWLVVLSVAGFVGYNVWKGVKNPPKKAEAADKEAPAPLVTE